MAMYPPVVSVAGFAKVDRGMFTAVSNLTKKLGCCKEQVRLVPLRNNVKINLQISGGRLVPLRLDSLVYCTGTFTHISARVFLLMGVQKLGVMEIAGVLLQRVPMYDNKHSIYAHEISRSELPFTTKMITTISMLHFGTKRIISLTVTINNFTTDPLNLTLLYYRVVRCYYHQLKFNRRTPLIKQYFFLEKIDTNKHE
jgi:hypothetical protein